MTSTFSAPLEVFIGALSPGELTTWITIRRKPEILREQRGDVSESVAGYISISGGHDSLDAILRCGKLRIVVQVLRST